MIGLLNLQTEVAASLYREGGKQAGDFHSLSQERKQPWLDDAARVIPIVAEACADLVGRHDPEKPANYLHKREHLPDEIRARYVEAVKKLSDAK